MSLKYNILTYEQRQERKRELKRVRQAVLKANFKRAIQREVRGLPSMWSIP